MELCPLSPRVEMKCYPTTSAANSTSAISQLSPAPRPSARSLWAAQPGLEGPGRARTARGHRTAAVPGLQGKGNGFAVRFRLQNGSLLQLRCNTKRVKATQLMCKVEAPQYLMQNGAGNTHFYISFGEERCCGKIAAARRCLPNGTRLLGRADALWCRRLFPLGILAESQSDISE